MSPWYERVPSAGPLVALASRFVSRASAGRSEGLPRGGEGLRWLAGAFDAFIEAEATPREEVEFVEGAGAVLGLLLLDHLGRGAHVERDGVHRVQLGDRGFFDPFGAVERALDAEDPRASLSHDVARAEREAEGSGPIARASSCFEAMLGERRPDLAVTARFDRSVWVGEGIEIDLGRVIDAGRGQHERALDQAVSKLIDLLPGGAGRTVLGWPEASARLLPRIVGAKLVDDVGAGLALRPMLHGLSVALVLAYEGRVRFVRASEIEAWGLSLEAVVHRSIENLAARSHAARVVPVEPAESGLVGLRSGDGLDSARLLLPGLHTAFAASLGTPFLAAVPHRDALLAAPVGRAGRAALSARAHDDAARAPHAISASLFLVTEGGLRAT